MSTQGGTKADLRKIIESCQAEITRLTDELADARSTAFREGWNAGAKKMREEIVNDVWGSWAQAGVESIVIPPPPEEKK